MLAVIIIAALAAALLPAAVLNAGPIDPREFLESPAAVRGDGVHRLGLRLSPAAAYPETPLAPALRTGVPLGASADLSGQIPPVGDQGQQGSCVGWATSYYYKSWSEKLEHTTWNLTDGRYQFSPSFVYNQINGGSDQGSTFQDAFTLLQTKGDVDISEFPYSQNNCTSQPTAMQLQEAKPYRIPTGWTSFWNRSTYGPYNPANDITNAKGWLASGRLLVMGIPIYNDFPDYGSNPARSYYDYNGTSTIAGGHAVAIVGYDDNANPGGADADHRGAFKMVNSWGTSWNGGGFVYLSYDFAKRYVWEAWTMGDNGPDTPSVTGLSATSGSVGDSIDINGNNFGGLRRSARVTFNGTSATQLTWTNEKVTALVPAGATSGPVIAYDWEGTASNPVQFTVGGGGSGPSVSSVVPAGGENTGPVSISVRGSGFVSGCTVKLAKSGSPDIAGTGVSFVDAGRVDCTVNITGAAVGAWDVVVSNPGGASGALGGGFAVRAPGGGGDTFEPNDTVETAYGPIRSGIAYDSYIWTEQDVDLYTIDTQGAPSLAVDLTSVPAGCDYDLYVYNEWLDLVGYSDKPGNADERVTLTRPARGTYILEVVPYTGSSQQDGYRLVFNESTPTAPAITGISPSAGPSRSRVNITGRGFGPARGASYVSFGSVRVATGDYVYWSDTRITCFVPAAVGARVTVTVTTTNGTSNGAAFSVTPTIRSLSPGYGRAGSWVTIAGQGFGPWSGANTGVYFGATRATRYSRWDNTTIVVQVPWVYPGRVAIRVRTAGGASNVAYFTVTR